MIFCEFAQFYTIVILFLAEIENHDIQEPTEENKITCRPPAFFFLLQLQLQYIQKRYLGGTLIYYEMQLFSHLFEISFTSFRNINDYILMILLIRFEIKQTFNCCSTSIQYFFNKPENSRDLDHVMDCTMGWNYFWRKIMLSVKMQARKNKNCTLRDVSLPIYLHLIFDILYSKKLGLMNLIFSLFQTWI